MTSRNLVRWEGLTVQSSPTLSSPPCVVTLAKAPETFRSRPGWRQGVTAVVSTWRPKVGFEPTEAVASAAPRFAPKRTFRISVRGRELKFGNHLGNISRTPESPIAAQAWLHADPRFNAKRSCIPSR
jgi:hypothetical protein